MRRVLYLRTPSGSDVEIIVLARVETYDFTRDEVEEIVDSLADGLQMAIAKTCHVQLPPWRVEVEA